LTASARNGRPRAAAADGRSRPWLVGIDIGGTFTDLVAIDASSGRRVSLKALTTPSDPLDGVLEGLTALLQRYEISLSRVAHIVHATTLATNILLERSGPRVALVTTEGFRDVIEQGREDRYDIYDLQIEVQKPLVERRYRIGIAERTDARGAIVRDLDLDAVRRAAVRLRRAKVESVAVCFLNSFRNAANEQEAARLLRETIPNAYLSLSSEVSPVIREYERFLATTINAYVGPKVASYVNRMASTLADLGFAGELGIMKSDGSISTPDEASRYAVRILESGPAAGVIAAGLVARQCDERLTIAFDMGGTTAKASLVVGGEPSIIDEIEVSRLERSVKGSGLPVRVPSVDVLEVGTGGGSLASVDSLGFLQVGPKSAAADPGPACFGRGGDGATVTDANLVLGYLNPSNFAGGEIHLDTQAAERAIEKHVVAHTAALDVIEAAWGIRDLVNESMARAVRLQCVEHGVDPAQATLVATGGGGPVHASSLLDKLGCRRVICPVDPGVSSAFGLLAAPRAIDHTVTDLALLDELGASRVETRLTDLESDLRKAVSYQTSGFAVRRFLDMRLHGQAYEIRISVAHSATQETLVEAFNTEYSQRFGRSPQSGRLEIVNWTVRLVEGGREALEAQNGTGAGPHDVPTQARALYFGPAVGWHDAQIVQRSSLKAGARLEGPLVVEEPAATTVVAPGQSLERDDHGNLHVFREAHA
jgi:N-methylhydantoinase A/oxoprolinase/acetone carboxylase beta subunit